MRTCIDGGVLIAAEQAGLDALDALHIAAAKLGGAEEFVTTERLTTTLFRVVGLKMTTILGRPEALTRGHHGDCTRAAPALHVQTTLSRATAAGCH
jgi:hypothetical protein